MADVSDEVLKVYKKAVTDVLKSQYACISSALKGAIKIFAEGAYAANLITEPVKGDAVQCTHDQYNKIFGDVYNDFKTVIELSKCVEEVQEHCHSFIKILEDLHGPAETVGKNLNSELSTLSDFLNLLSLHNVQFNSLMKEIDDGLIIEISRHIDNYTEVGHGLNLSEGIMESITKSKENDTQRMIGILWAWKKKNGNASTSMELIKAFLRMSYRIAAERVLKHLSKATEPLESQFTFEPQNAYPNWDVLTESEREAIRNKLMNENRDVREAFTILFSQLIDSFEERNVNPKIIQSLVHTFSGSLMSNQHEDHSSIADVFYALSKHCTWFNYESLHVIVKVRGSENEKKCLKEYEDIHLIPYLKHSIFEIPSASNHDQAQRTSLYLKVSEDLSITGKEVKAVQRNLAKLLGFENSASLHFDNCEVGCIELIFSLPTIILENSSSKSQMFAYIEWEKTRNGLKVNADLVTILSCCEKAEVSILIKLLIERDKQSKHNNLNKRTAEVEPVISNGKLIEKDFLQQLKNEKKTTKQEDQSKSLITLATTEISEFKFIQKFSSTSAGSTDCSQLLERFSERLSQIVLSAEVIQLLYTEKVISKETSHEIESLGGSLVNGSLAELQATVSKNPNQLKVFASVLLHSKKTVPIAYDIFNNCEQAFQQKVFVQQVHQEFERTSKTEKQESKDITKDPQSQRTSQKSDDAEESIHMLTFESLHQKFVNLISTVTCLITVKVSSLTKLKNHLQRIFRELKPQLTHAKSTDDVIAIIVEKYNIINIDCLEAVVDHLEVTEAKNHISAYKKTVTMFCEEVNINMCYNASFQTASSSCLLTCETLQLTLEWKAHKHKLKDIQELLTILFKDNHNRIYVTDIREENFIIVTCYTPQHMVSVLLMEVNENSQAVEECDVIRLTIGYYTVCDKLKGNEKKSKGTQTIDFISKVENKKPEKEREDLPDGSHEKLKDDLQLSKRKCSAMARQIEDLKSQKKDSEQLEKVITKLSFEKQQLEEAFKTLEEEKERHQMEKKILNTKLLEINSLREEKKLLEDKLKMEQLKVKEMEQKMDTIMGSRVPLLYDGWKAELQSPPVQAVMSNFNYYKKSDEEWYSPSFLSYLNGYEMCVRIAANGEDEGQGTHLSLYIHLIAGKNDDNLSWPFRGEVKIQLINRIDDHDHYEQNIVFDDSSNVQACSRVINGIPIKAGLANRVGEGTALFISHDILTSTLDFLVEDSISIRIKEVIVHSSPTIVPSTPSDSLPVIHDFIIDNFLKRQQSNEECISDPFYSHENGYKLSLLVYPNGRDKWKNKYISMFVHLMKGENDNNLTFPFRGKILVQIVNLKENKNHAERLVEFNEKTDPKGEYGARLTGLTGLLSGRQYRGYGYPNFLSHKFLEFDKSRNTQYVSDDDTVHIRILKI